MYISIELFNLLLEFLNPEQLIIDYRDDAVESDCAERLNTLLGKLRELNRPGAQEQTPTLENFHSSGFGEGIEKGYAEQERTEVGRVVFRK